MSNKQFYSKEYKLSMCEEFFSKQQSTYNFCREKNIACSTFNRWISKYRSNKSGRFFVEVGVKTADIDIQRIKEPIQVVLPNKIKINIPPNFCSESLGLILLSIGGNNA